ncbi:zinc dependent phospholipase C family protein [Alicyclobacillus fodiniaquatilis]|uniref:Zinc dependent phospholipase C family protein n=1 Tax=Alicyclobacillus fodiniaquatilis TaxID=1661150 RepID=A0ABW4JGL9_9BACL
MGSRFMHLLIADYVVRELDISDRGDALLGAIAPDARAEKLGAHFKGDLHRYALNAPIDFGRFVVKYRDRFTDAFFLGYLTHLITDDIWTMKTDFSGFEARLKAQPELYKIYHADLWLCNAKLDEIYRPHGVYDALSSAHTVPDMDEIDGAAVLAYKHEALNDFTYPIENRRKPLSLFTLEDMIHYVERAKSKSLDICRMVKSMTS